MNRGDLRPSCPVRSATLIGLDPPAATPAPAAPPSSPEAVPRSVPRASRRLAALGSCAAVAVLALMLAGHLRAKDSPPSAQAVPEPATSRARAAADAAASLAAFPPPVEAPPTSVDAQPRPDTLPPPFSAIPAPAPHAPAVPRSPAARPVAAPAPRPIPDLIEGEAPPGPTIDPLAGMTVDGALQRVDPTLSPFALARVDAAGIRPRAELAIRAGDGGRATSIGWFEDGESLPGGWTVVHVGRDATVDLLTPRGNLLRLDAIDRGPAISGIDLDRSMPRRLADAAAAATARAEARLPVEATRWLELELTGPLAPLRSLLAAVVESSRSRPHGPAIEARLTPLPTRSPIDDVEASRR